MRGRGSRRRHLDQLGPPRRLPGNTPDDRQEHNSLTTPERTTNVLSNLKNQPPTANYQLPTAADSTAYGLSISSLRTQQPTNGLNSEAYDPHATDTATAHGPGL
jgi:hypothetical protein